MRILISACALFLMSLHTPLMAQDANTDQTVKALEAKVNALVLKLSKAESRIADLEAQQGVGAAPLNEDGLRDYLVSNSDVIFMDALEEFQRNESFYTRKRFAKTLDREGLRDRLYFNANDPFIGNPESQTVLVEFFDYNCGYCKRAANSLFDLAQKDPDLKIVFKELPILSEGSRTAARAALASKMQGKYFEYHAKLMTHPGRLTDPVLYQIAEQVGLNVDKLKADMLSNEVSVQIAETAQIARTLGVSGTPAFMVGDEFMPSAVPLPQLEAAIAATRALTN